MRGSKGKGNRGGGEERRTYKGAEVRDGEVGKFG